ncbi:hypothetical protein J1614_003824 [Plenodomus biglobosus]|nr:hypothetical protein J1614_003824 [Plenodomus biglobosus]
MIPTKEDPERRKYNGCDDRENEDKQTGNLHENLSRFRVRSSHLKDHQPYSQSNASDQFESEIDVFSQRIISATVGTVSCILDHQNISNQKGMYLPPITRIE